MLTRRDYSQQEIRQKLLVKGFFSHDIDAILSDFVQTGLINEARFIENYIHWRRAKGYGPLRISMELQGRGIATEMIAEHLDITDNAWFIDAHHVWHKHFKGKLPTDFKHRVKHMRFLQYRGFTREQIEYALGSDVVNEE